MVRYRNVRGYLARWDARNSTIYKHREIMAAHLNRKLRTNEHVHHINGDKRDNRIENLKILTPREHVILTFNLKPKKKRACIICGKITFNKKYCSNYCHSKHNFKQPWSKQFLEKYKGSSYLKISKILNVSDKTVAKWFKKFKI